MFNCGDMRKSATAPALEADGGPDIQLLGEVTILNSVFSTSDWVGLTAYVYCFVTAQ